MLKSRRPARPEDVAREATAVGPPEPGADGAHVLSELERLLRKPGCPACHYVEEIERSFFSWLQIESFSVAEVQARLRASVGMCPVHSRRLVEEIGEGHVMTIVVREALAGARQRAREELEPGSCPACDAIAFGAQRARQMVLGGLSDPARAREYSDHPGICLAHFLDAAPQLERSTLEPMARRLLRSLADTDDGAVVALLGGTDPDAARRARWRECLPEPSTDRSTVAGLVRRIEIEACPVCLSTGLGDRDYVAWHAERVAQGDRSLRNDPGELCSAHLHDLALADRALAAPAIEHKRVTTIGKLERLLRRLADMPEPSRRGRRTTDEELDTARHEIATRPYCPACNARGAIEQSQLALVGAALALPTVRECYERSHGLCLRHAVQIFDVQAARLARRHVDARLGALAWEVGETARKYAWAYRHESSGHEQHAWLRALAQIDGRVFEGGAAPAGIPRSPAEPG